uniref:Putative secreted protein n=1 Tax=Ixodes ricinus TaxID=34613 RepID=A0A147BK95_IXORI
MYYMPYCFLLLMLLFRLRYVTNIKKLYVTTPALAEKGSWQYCMHEKNFHANNKGKLLQHRKQCSRSVVSGEKGIRLQKCSMQDRLCTDLGIEQLCVKNLDYEKKNKKNVLTKHKTTIAPFFFFTNNEFAQNVLPARHGYEHLRGLKVSQVFVAVYL